MPDTSGKAQQQGRVLVIAGSDSGGGAGIQADIKTITMLGAYASTAVTAITAQNTFGVTAIQAITPDMIKAQIHAVLTDIGADVIKTGMLADRATITAVCDALHEADYKGLLVVDPVMVATSGDRLQDDQALDCLRDILLPLADVVTPNIPELELLTERSVNNMTEMEEAGRHLLKKGAKSVVAKGGHLNADKMTDILITWNSTLGDRDELTAGDQITSDHINCDRIHSRNTHGTGCTFASAMAAWLSHGFSLTQAFHQAHGFVQDGILTAPDLGQGHGPLGHNAIIYQQVIDFKSAEDGEA